MINALLSRYLLRYVIAMIFHLLIFRMYGFFQTTFYFGYMVIFSLGLGLMCGNTDFRNDISLCNSVKSGNLC